MLGMREKGPVRESDRMNETTKKRRQKTQPVTAYGQKLLSGQ